MKYAIDLGHNVSFDGGARGVKSNENELIVEVGNKVIAKLKALGHQVVECKPKKANSLGHSLRQRTYTANAHRCDQFISIHFNAFDGNAHGVEILYVSDAGKRIATPVLEEIAKLGFYNRGLKYRNNLHVLRRTNMPAILVECCFCDNWKDIERFDAEKMASAIVKGLTGQSPNSSPRPCPTCGKI
jgi:N-acetylmuramoyl-L-alanine amidase